MKHKINILVYAFAIFLISNPAFCKEHYVENGFFRMIVPKNWSIVPQEELNKFQNIIFDTHKEKVKYDLALQASNSSGWFVHPYILIQIDSRGKQYTQRQIEGGIKKSNVAKTIKLRKEEYKNIIFQLDDNDVFYDREGNIIYTKIALYDKNAKVEALLAQVLTNYGAIRVMFYDLENTYNINVAVMYDFLKSIAVDPDKQFKLKAYSSTQNNDPLANALIMGVLAIITSFLIMTIRKRKNN